jgi:hypothetical protein
MSIQRQQELLLRPLHTPDDLHRWVRLFCNLDVPRVPARPGSSAPFDYLVRAYFEPASDQVVHACRGGGKTRLAAAATLLDLLHKPGISVRILGGSLEQSTRMWEHLLPDLTHAARELINRRTGNAKRITLANGSSCAVLTQSERCVRGLRVQKLRCDEIEVFSPEVWEAAQLVTRSAARRVGFSPRPSDERRAPVARGLKPTLQIHGAIDALSTLHKPFGLMQRVIEQAEANGIPVVRWNLIDVLEPCPAERDCASCPLLADCGGVAKNRPSGFVRIDDAIRMKKRVSLETWRNEMLCERPTVENAAFASFDPTVHVRSDIAMHEPATSLAVDFGVHAPFVCLWVQTDAEKTYVIDEYMQKDSTVDDHVLEMQTRPWPTPTHLDCDPAGAARNDQTGMSNVTRLRRAGYHVRHRTSRIDEGVEAIRVALRPAAGSPTLFIHPRCRNLIRSITCLTMTRLRDGAKPHKDGTHDHAVDALRYHFVNRGRREMEKRLY